MQHRVVDGADGKAATQTAAPVDECPCNAGCEGTAKSSCKPSIIERCFSH